LKSQQWSVIMKSNNEKNNIPNPVSRAFRAAALGLALGLAAAPGSAAEPAATPMQSPIDIRPTLTAGLSALQPAYQAVPLRIVNTGHTAQVDLPTGGKLQLNGESFDLVQLHFHAPAEHMIGGKRYDMEVHLVHKDNKGKLAVIGIMVEEGRENAGLSPLWRHLPAASGQSVTPDGVTFDPSALFPKNLSHYELSGSLTTPPYTEGVQWLVLATPVQFSAAQIARFKGLFPANARPVQPANHRPVVFGY
jgi:carbonic anhydrase